MGVDARDFRRWEKDPVTKEIFSALKEIRRSVNAALTDANFILDGDFSRRAAHMLGKREGIDLVLEISLDDLENDGDSDTSNGA